MPADRHELEALARDQLVERARAIGIDRPEVLTRLELLDEILSAAIADEQERKIARGLLGRARDLVARVVEKGLNLPDAAQKLRTLAPPLSAWRRGPPPIATVSLAEIYAGQGHDKLALKVLDEVLEREPDHAYAHSLREKVSLAAQTPAAQAPEQASPDAIRKPVAARYNAKPSGQTSLRTVERSHAADPLPAPTSTDVPVREMEPPPRPSTALPNTPHAVVVPSENYVRLRVDRSLCHLSWAIRPRLFAREHYRRPDGKLAIRLVWFVPSWQGPVAHMEDVAIDALKGRMERQLPNRAEGLCAALGWSSREGFMALATAMHCTLAAEPSPIVPSPAR